VNDHRETLAKIYEAFGRGDVRTILSCVAEDVEWEYGWAESPIPWLVPGTGCAHVGRFFATAGEQLEFHRFEVNHILAGEDVAVALCSLDATVRATGKHIVEIDEPHVWYFNDAGLVRKMRHGADTLQQFRALQPD